MAVSFKGAHFPPEVILMGVRWYLAYPLSTRHGIVKLLGLRLSPSNRERMSASMSTDPALRPAASYPSFPPSSRIDSSSCRGTLTPTAGAVVDESVERSDQMPIESAEHDPLT